MVPSDPDQTDRFRAGEADSWFRRNVPLACSGKIGREVDLLVDILRPFKGDIHALLEIGCANGVKVEHLSRQLSAAGFGIDPSELAVEDGMKRLNSEGNSSVSLTTGTGDKLPYGTGQFDFVHFGFCLYLVARARLFSSIAEADRVLKPGGFLSIFDFDPPRMHRREYHHAPGIFAYKTRYDELFTASGHYHLVSKSSFSHDTDFFSKDGRERISLSVLYKEPEPYDLGT